MTKRQQEAQPVAPNPEATEQPQTLPDPAVTGGPGVGPASPAQPERRTVKIGAREFAVDPDVAEAYAQREREYETGFARQGEELGQLRARQREWDAQQERLRAAVTGTPAEPATPDIDTELFVNPKAALQRLKAEIISEQETRQLQTRQAQESREQFWNDFYGQHPDLSKADDHWLIESVLQRNFRSLAAMTTGEGMKKLGDLSRDAILGIIKKRTPATTEP